MRAARLTVHAQSWLHDFRSHPDTGRTGNNLGVMLGAAAPHGCLKIASSPLNRQAAAKRRELAIAYPETLIILREGGSVIAPSRNKNISN